MSSKTTVIRVSRLAFLNVLSDEERDLIDSVDGQTTIGEVLSGLYSPHERSLLDSLLEQDVLVPAQVVDPAHRNYGLWLRNGDRELKVKQRSVALRSEGFTPDTEDRIIKNFSADLAIYTQHSLVEDLTNADLVVLVCTDYLADRVAAFLQRLPASSSVLLVKATGRVRWYGPLISGSGTPACYSCMGRRLQEQRSITGRAGQGFAEAIDLVDLSWTRLVVARLETALIDKESAGTIVVVDGEERQSSHQIVHLQDCQLCGDTQDPHARDFDLSFATEPDPGRLAAELSNEAPARDRTTSPENLREALNQHVDHLQGVVRSVRTAHTPAGFVSKAVHYFPTSSYAVNSTTHTGGKGATEDEAWVSAVAEAVERYSAIHRASTKSRMASLTEIGVEGFHPNSVMGFSTAQYLDRHRINQTSSPEDFVNHIVPELFEEKDQIGWSPMWRLTVNPQRLVEPEPRWIPSALCWFGYQGGRGDRSRQQVRCDSNGLAAGANMSEALRFSLLELVERDAVGIWWHNRLPVTRVPLDAMPNYLRDVALRYEDLWGRKLWFLDITTDIGVPVFVAISARDDGTELIFGCAAHWDPHRAAEKAFDELAQCHAAFGFDPQQPRHGFGPAGARWWTEATLESEPHFDGPNMPAAAGPEGLSGRLTELVARIGAAGLECYVMDQTRSDISGLSVTRAIIPGAVHMWPRFGTDRIYDVPVLLGRTSTPNREAHLNKRPIFF